MKQLTKACADYIKYLDKQSPIVSTSHHYLRGLYDGYGKTAVDNEVERQFSERKADNHV
jgi:hypothetical protein